MSLPSLKKNIYIYLYNQTLHLHEWPWPEVTVEQVVVKACCLGFNTQRVQEFSVNNNYIIKVFFFPIKKRSHEMKTSGIPVTKLAPINYCSFSPKRFIMFVQIP